MRKILYLIAFLPVSYGGFGQNLQVNILLKGNITFPTINDETYVRPLPVDQNSCRLTEQIMIDMTFTGGLANVYGSAPATAQTGTFKSRLRTVALGLSYRIR